MFPLHEGHSMASPRIYVLHSGQRFISIPPLLVNSPSLWASRWDFIGL